MQKEPAATFDAAGEALAWGQTQPLRARVMAAPFFAALATGCIEADRTPPTGGAVSKSFLNGG